MDAFLKSHDRFKKIGLVFGISKESSIDKYVIGTGVCGLYNKWLNAKSISQWKILGTPLSASANNPQLHLNTFITLVNKTSGRSTVADDQDALHKQCHWEKQLCLC